MLALVRFYAREGYAKQLQTVCTEVLKKKPNDPLLVFWRAVGMLLEGASTEVRTPSVFPALPQPLPVKQSQ